MAVGVDPRAVRRQAGRHVDDVIAEPDRAELERGPVEVRAELLGDDDVVGGDLGGLLVGEFDRVGEGAAGGEEAGGAVAGGAEEVVGVVGRLVVGCQQPPGTRPAGGGPGAAQVEATVVCEPSKCRRHQAATSSELDLQASERALALQTAARSPGLRLAASRLLLDRLSNLSSADMG